MAKQHIVSDKPKHHKHAPEPKGCLLAIGGHESKSTGEADKTEDQKRNVEFEDEQILKFFVSKLKGNSPSVALIPTASTVPDQMIKEYQKVFRELGVKKLEVLDIRDRGDAVGDEYFKAIESADGIFFTGGDQLRLTSILGGTRLLQLMKERYTYDDILVAGTSAGAVALSTPMIYEVMTQGGFVKGDVRITTGLEFIKNVAFDTHFIQRGRMVRMAQCIVTNPGCVGIGLEEDTAVYITKGREMEVFGSGLITVVDGRKISCTDIYEIGTGHPFSVRDLRIHLLADGQKYTLPFYDHLHI
ncbi:cyanophycinase [Pontibacter mangrovi]|uniref:Cyanophycinase n=1 Tax=Pontibacter mangrovi TaxID=2589816 RepID=A0A501VZG9_9BACT|nr:cyanophycinase [Pontibacter mangrovi]TPE42428.1 cyanophycinase [Pontibacter mangrovi]